MKKTRLLILLFVLNLLIFTGCSAQESKDQNKVYDISIESAIVLSHNTVKSAGGNVVYVNIEMTSGQYAFDELPGAFQGNNWSGQYQIRIYEDESEFNNPVYLAPIFIDDSQVMNFKGEFSLVFDDYNQDNNPDFTLGQFLSSNGYAYALFTINETGVVNKLDTDGLLFSSEQDYSIQLEKMPPVSFRTSSYDNRIGETVERIYQWKDTAFILEE